MTSGGASFLICPAITILHTGVYILKGIRVSIAGKLVLISFIIIAVLVVLISRDILTCTDNRIMPMLQDSVLEIEKWQDDRPLRVAIYPGGGFAAGILENNGLKVNRESKFFRNHSLLVEFILVEDPEQCMELLADNKIDIAWSDLQHFTRQYSIYRNINPAAFMQYSWSAGEHAVITKGITSVQGIKGRKALCVETGISHFLALYYLRCNGLAGSDLKWKFTYTDSDANSLFPGDEYSVRAVSRLLETGVNGTVLVSTREADRLIPGLFIASEQDLHVNMSHIQKFLMGWMEGVNDLRGNREPAEKLLVSSYQVSLEKAKFMLDSVYPVDINENIEFFGMKGKTLNGFSELFDLAEDIWINAGFNTGHGFSNFAKDTDILTSVFTGKSAPKVVSAPGRNYPAGNSENLKPFCSTTIIDFDKDSLVFSFSMKNRLKDFAMVSARFSALPIRIDAGTLYPGEPISAYRWAVRIRNILDMLAEFGIDRNRCYLNKIDPITVSDQKAVAAPPAKEHVMLTIVSGESMRK